MSVRSRPRVGISRCLLGEPVRYDGGHKYNPLIAEKLGSHFQWIPICPEVECGLGVPRETLRLVGPRLVATESNRDMTDIMLTFANSRVRDLLTAGIHGCILKARSPSCGLKDPAPRVDDNGIGLFASVLTTHCPSLPCEDETRLQQRDVRDQFIARVIAYQKRNVHGR